MESITVLLARAAALMDIAALDPNSVMSPPDAISALIEKYAFTRYPKFDEIDLQKGVQFSYGKLREINIVNLTLFATGIAIDTGSSTDHAETVLLDFLDSARRTLGASIQPRRRVFLSNLGFTSSMKMTVLHPVLQQIADRVTASVSRDIDQPLNYEPTAVFINLDPSLHKFQPSSFTIDRRAEMPFSENSYFSAAPLRTAEHIELVKLFEDALLACH
ncbi:MAG: hypothetical protein ABSH50_17580 [Bryobacteraceae bacterium]|jgi:hypothetical protein